MSRQDKQILKRIAGVLAAVFVCWLVFVLAAELFILRRQELPII